MVPNKPNLKFLKRLFHTMFDPIKIVIYTLKNYCRRVSLLLNDDYEQITPGNNEQMGFFLLRFDHSVTSFFFAYIPLVSVKVFGS